MKKRTLTLIEIMIVILLITIIGGAVGYNMKGSLDKGKKFRTERGIEQLHDMLLLCLDEGKEGDKVADNPYPYIRDLGLSKDASKALLDGWGKPYKIKYIPEKRDFEISSESVGR